MKTLTISQLIKTYKSAFRRIPDDGIMLTKNGRPIAKIIKPDFKKVQEEVKAIAEKVVRKIHIDTFTEVEVGKLESTMGICDRCGRTGEVKKSGYVNKNGTIVGKWLCTSNCHEKAVQSHSVQAVKTSDFGRSNE